MIARMDGHLHVTVDGEPADVRFTGRTVVVEADQPKLLTVEALRALRLHSPRFDRGVLPRLAGFDLVVTDGRTEVFRIADLARPLRTLRADGPASVASIAWGTATGRERRWIAVSAAGALAAVTALAALLTR